MGEAKQRAARGDLPEKDGRSKAEREHDEMVAAVLAEDVLPHPQRVTWGFLRMKQPDGETMVVLVMHTALGPQHYFFAPEDLQKFAGHCEGAAEEALGAGSGLHVVKKGGIHVPGADDPI